MMCTSRFAPVSFAFGLSLALLAAGCTGPAQPIVAAPPLQPPVIGGPAPPMPAVVTPLPPPSTVPLIAMSVSGAGQALTLAMQAATVYTNLPRCDAPGASMLCSEREIVREIRAAAIKAHNAYLAARRNEALLGTAIEMIGLFQNIIPRA